MRNTAVFEISKRYDSLAVWQGHVMSWGCFWDCIWKSAIFAEVAASESAWGAFLHDIDLISFLQSFEWLLCRYCRINWACKETMRGFCSKNLVTRAFEITVWIGYGYQSVWRPTTTSHVLSPFRFWYWLFKHTLDVQRFELRGGEVHCLLLTMFWRSVKG